MGFGGWIIWRRQRSCVDQAALEFGSRRVQGGPFRHLALESETRNGSQGVGHVNSLGQGGTRCGRARTSLSHPQNATNATGVSVQVRRAPNDLTRRSCAWTADHSSYSKYSNSRVERSHCTRRTRPHTCTLGSHSLTSAASGTSCGTPACTSPWHLRGRPPRPRRYLRAAHASRKGW